MAKRTAPLSFDEKRRRLHDVLLQKKEFFNFKEIEKFATKAGIAEGTAKDVLQSLVDDSLVCADKIGSGNYYWSFPSQAAMRTSNAIEKTLREIRSTEDELEAAAERTAACLHGRRPCEQRTRVLAEVAALEDAVAAASRETSAMRAGSTEMLAQYRSEERSAVASANAMLDAVFLLQSYVSTAFSMEKAVFNAHFGLPDDLDYVE